MDSIPLFTISVLAAADIDQCYLIGANGQLASTTNNAVGVVRTRCKSGEMANAMAYGVVDVVVHEDSTAITAGKTVGVAAGGTVKLINDSGTIYGTDCGIALADASGDRVKVLFHPTSLNPNIVNTIA